MDLLPMDNLEFLRRKIAEDMIAMELEIKTIHHENGPGQHEIEFQANEALKQADNLQTAKMISKIEANQSNLTATYMPKPIPKVEGSGLHIHQYLTKNGKNVFADEEGGISDTLRHYIGGIQKHINAISAIVNPITNSYKRLVAHYEAPVYISWGVGNRTALIRVPGYEKDARIEYRAGDGAMNIYLGTAILLAAGMDGIEHKIEPNNPTTKNIYRMEDEEREALGIKILPRSLEESIKHFQESEFVKDILGDELFNSFLDEKLEEIRAYKKAKSNNIERSWEFEHYLHC
jgi:glutamine synthetase